MSANENRISERSREPSPFRRAPRDRVSPTVAVIRRTFSLLAVLPMLMARRGAVRILVIIVLLREAGGL